MESDQEVECPVCHGTGLDDDPNRLCPECDGTDWTIEQPAPGESLGADPDAVCQRCGNRGRVDENGVWW